MCPLREVKLDLYYLILVISSEHESVESTFRSLWGLITTNELHTDFHWVSCWWHWRLHFHFMDHLSVVTVLLVWCCTSWCLVNLVNKDERKRMMMMKWRKRGAGEVEIKKKEWIENLERAAEEEERVHDTDPSWLSALLPPPPSLSHALHHLLRRSSCLFSAAPGLEIYYWQVNLGAVPIEQHLPSCE